MNCKEALKYIEESHKFGMKLGLETTEKLMELLGNPQDRLKFVHVAGTNGKGSICSFIAKVLEESGYKTGLFTSPFLEVFNERIRINGENISDEKIAEITGIIKEKIDIMVSEGYSYPTEFEIVTAMAFVYYAMENVDYVVLEVGLGGRYDSTNIIKNPSVCVIGSISLDHTKVLGDTVEKIAYEKGGIIKPNSKVVVYSQKPHVMNILKEISKENNAELIEASFEDVEIIKESIDSQIFSFSTENKKYENMEISLIGEHQIKNAITAINAVEILSKEANKITETSLRTGMKNTRWAGRVEKVMEKPVFILDGAHNADGAESLEKVIKKYFSDKKVKFLIGMLEDKDIDTVLSKLIPLCDYAVTSTPDSPRAMSSDRLAEKISIYGCNTESVPDVESAIDRILEVSSDEDIIIAAGSLYMTGKIRSIFRKRNII